jgi:hypothetical protein
VALQPCPQCRILNYLRYDCGSGEKLLVFGGSDGTLQALSARGDSLLASDTTILRTIVSSLKDSSESVPLYRLGKPQGKLLGLAASGNTVYSVHAKGGLLKTPLTSDLDFLNYHTEKFVKKNLRAGPMITSAGVWVADSAYLYKISTTDFPKRDSIRLPDNFVIHDMAVCGGPEGSENIALVGQCKNCSYNGFRDIASLTVSAKPVSV